jgi:hypothetical protein
MTIATLINSDEAAHPRQCRGWAFNVLLLLLVSGCATATEWGFGWPTENDAKKAILKNIETSNKPIQVVEFQQTKRSELQDSSSVGGHSFIDFKAEIEFTKNCRWYEGLRVDGSTEDSGKEVKKGQREKIRGTVYFRKSESDSCWQVNNIHSWNEEKP